MAEILNLETLEDNQRRIDNRISTLQASLQTVTEKMAALAATMTKQFNLLQSSLCQSENDEIALTTRDGGGSIVSGRMENQDHINTVDFEPAAATEKKKLGAFKMFDEMPTPLDATARDEGINVDVFRFDIASIITKSYNLGDVVHGYGKPIEGFAWTMGTTLSNPPLVQWISNDPVLHGVKIIDEAWDPGGLYHVGHLPSWGIYVLAKVLRDGTCSEQDAAILVPDDIISIKLGDIIPADCRLLEGDTLRIDQSALAGESLLIAKKLGYKVFSDSICKQGEIEAVVIATGVHTFFGKAAHLVDNTNKVGNFQMVLTAIGNFCACSIVIGMIVEIIVMYPIQKRPYKDDIDNLLVLLIGGIPIAMPTVMSVPMAIESHRLSQQGAITNRMTAIEEMTGMDVLCSDETGNLTLNKLRIDKNLIEVFANGVRKDDVVLLATMAARTENQDDIDAAMVGMLADPKEVRAGIKEVHFFQFNPVDKRTALTYVDIDGNWYRVSKGAPEQILSLCNCTEALRNKVHNVIDKYAEHGLRSLVVARQEVPEKSKASAGGNWQFVGLLPLFDPPRHDSCETIQRALNLGVNVKIITRDQLAIAKETGRRLGMGTNMYPSSSLLGQNKDASIASLPVDELIETIDGFAEVFPEHKYEIVKKLQERNHICGMTGDGVNDVPALTKTDIEIAIADATDAARGAARPYPHSLRMVLYSTERVANGG